MQNQAASSMGLVVLPEALIEAIEHSDHTGSKAVPLTIRIPLTMIFITTISDLRWLHFNTNSIINWKWLLRELAQASQYALSLFHRFLKVVFIV